MGSKHLTTLAFVVAFVFLMTACQNTNADEPTKKTQKTQTQNAPPGHATEGMLTGVVVETMEAGGYTYALVEVGDRVVAGQVIATVGSSGRTTGPHLHLEVQRNGASLDPTRAALTGDAVRQALLGVEI